MIRQTRGLDARVREARAHFGLNQVSHISCTMRFRDFCTILCDPYTTYDSRCPASHLLQDMSQTLIPKVQP